MDLRSPALIALTTLLPLLGCDPADDMGNDELEQLEIDSEGAPEAVESTEDLTTPLPPPPEEADPETVLDLTAPLDPAAAAGWGDWIKDTSPPSTCDTGYVVDAVDCWGSYCDQMQLHCTAQPLTAGASTWSSWFSEEGTSWRYCSSGAYVSGLKCRGWYCDDLSIECTDIGQPHGTCQWSGWHGSNDPWFSTPGDTLIAGVQCSGAYCDEQRFYYCTH